MSLFSRRVSGRNHKKSEPHDLDRLEGVITFFGAHHALKGEKILSEKEIDVFLIPGPREISPNCGTALRFDYAKKDKAAKLLEENNILFEKIHFYPARKA